MNPKSDSDPGRRNRGFATLLLTTLVSAASAQSRVADLYPGTSDPDSRPFGFVTLGAHAYFSTLDAQGRRSLLWRSDGTAAGTSLVAWLGPEVDIEQIVPVGARLFVHAREHPLRTLWVSDGTLAGTQPLARFRFVDEMVDAAGTLFFAATTDEHGSELWRSDGTVAGTTLVTDLRPGSSGSEPRSLAALGGQVLFSADAGTFGREPYRSDGTAAGTRIVLDLNPGPAGSEPYGMQSLLGFVWFSASEPATGFELYRSNGVSTNRVADLNPGAANAHPGVLGAIGSAVLFSADDGVRGAELWQTRGTAATTSLVADIWPGAESSSPRRAVRLANATLGELLYFQADDGSRGRELWRSDGTTAGTVLVADLVAGPGDSWPTALLALPARGTLLFSVDYLGWPQEGLWRTGAFGLGATRLDDRDVISATVVGSDALFSRGRLGDELWRSDASAAGTSELADLRPIANLGAYPRSFAELDEELWFAAEDPTRGVEPWLSDGSAAGTRLVADVAPGAADSHPHPLGTLQSGRLMVFTADHPAHGREPWASRGDAATTVLLADIVPGSRDSRVSDAVVMAGVMYFHAEDDTHGRELWRTDGTPAGTSLLIDLNPGATRGVVGRLARVGDWIYFFGDDGSTGLELWRTNGSALGTQLVADLAPGPASSSVFELIAVGGTLWFTADTSTHGWELWMSDGTAAGTRIAADLVPGPESSYPMDLRDGSRGVYFTAQTPATGRELWYAQSSGTVRLVHDVWPGPESSFPYDLTVAGSKLFFSALAPDHGRELWQTAIASASASLVVDLDPGPRSGLAATWPAPIAPLGSSERVLFMGHRRGEGAEPWRSDGTAAGTWRVGDLDTVDPWGSFASGFTRIGRTDWFLADDGASGFELWSVDLQQTHGVLAEPLGNSSIGTNGLRSFIEPIGYPYVGAASFELELRAALSFQPALLLLSFTRGDLDLGSGCVVYPALPAISLPAPATNAQGRSRVPLPIPASAALLGAQAFTQFVWADPGGRCLGGIASFSRALWIVISD